MCTVGVWTRMTRLPRGKKRELSLREKEKQIQADLFDHIVTRGGNYTVVGIGREIYFSENRCRS